MKRMLCMITLLPGILVGLSGCFHGVKDDCKSAQMESLEPIDSAIAEIDAVKNLGNDGARFNVLMAIAQRPGLSPSARAHLAKSVTMLGNDGARHEVLMALARNVPPMPIGPQPAVPMPRLPNHPFQPPIDPAVAEIDAVKNLGNDGARFDVLMAIAQRPGLSPSARAHLAESVTMLGSDAARHQVLMALARNVPPMPQLPLPPQAEHQPLPPQRPQPPTHPQ